MYDEQSNPDFAQTLLERLIEDDDADLLMQPNPKFHALIIDATHGAEARPNVM